MTVHNFHISHLQNKFMMQYDQLYIVNITVSRIVIDLLLLNEENSCSDTQIFLK